MAKKMKFENKFLLINLIPVVVLLLFGLYMYLSISGAFDSIFGDGFLSDLIPSNGEESGPGDGYLLIGGLFLGAFSGLAYAISMVFFVFLPIVSAFYIIFWSGLSRLCLLGEKSLSKLKLSKLLMFVGNLANLAYVLFFGFILINGIFDYGLKALFCIFPLSIFAFPLVYTFRVIFKVKEY